MFSQRRAASNPPSHDDRASQATLAAAKAFLQHRESNSSLSAAAAAAALRTHAKSPLSVAEVQTKRTLRRAESNVSNSSNGSLTRRIGAPGLARKTSSSSIAASMSERTFRETGPPPGPKQHEPYSVVPHPGYYSNKSLPHLPRDSQSEADERSRTYSLGSRPRERGLAAAQLAMRASSFDLSNPPPVPPLPPTRQYTAPTSSSVPGLRPSEVNHIQYGLEKIANKPVKRKQIQSTGPKTTPLTDRHVGGRASGTAVDKINALRQGGLTDAEEQSSESAAAVALKHSYAAPKRKPLSSGLTDREERNSESAAAAALHHALPPGRAPSFEAQPTRSAVATASRAQQTPPKRQSEPKPIPQTAAVQVQQPQSTAVATTVIPNHERKPSQDNNLPRSAERSQPQPSKSPAPVSSPAFRQMHAIQPGPAHGRNNSVVSNASDRSQQLQVNTAGSSSTRAASLSPSRKAHFATGAADTSDGAVKHEPLPRALSPVKSALKHSRTGSTSPMGATFADGITAAPAKVHSESDTTSVLSDEDRTASLTRRKKANRVSFDDELVVVRPHSPPTSLDSTSPSPDHKTKPKKWFGVAKARRPSEDSVEEEIPDIKPTPSLPSFRSVHSERAGEHDSREPLPPVVTSVDRMADSSDSEDEDMVSDSRPSATQSHAKQIPEIALVAATPTPKEEKTSYIEAKDAHLTPEVEEPVPDDDDLYTSDLKHPPPIDVIEEESENSSIYSDAEETLTDIEGFASIDAVMEDKPTRSSATKETSTDTEKGESPSDWTPHQEYWRGLSEYQKTRLEQQAAVMAAENKAAREAEAAAKRLRTKVKDTAVVPPQKQSSIPPTPAPKLQAEKKPFLATKTMRKPAADSRTAAAVESKQLPKQQEKPPLTRTTMRQKPTPAAKAEEQKPAPRISNSAAPTPSMRTSMRGSAQHSSQESPSGFGNATRSSFRSSMRSDAHPETQKSALPTSGGLSRGSLRQTMRDPRPTSITSMPEISRPRTPPSASRRVSSPVGMSPIKESPLTPPHGRRTLQKRLLRGSPSPLASPAESYGSGSYFPSPSTKRSDRIGRMTRRISDGYDSDGSESSFRRSPAKPGSAFSNMTMRGRKVESPASRPEAGRMGSFSMRSRSPSLRSEASGTGFFSKNSLRSFSLTKNKVEKDRKSSIIPSFSKSKANGSKSRIVDSSDDEVEVPRATYKSRFAEESDDEAVPFSPVRGIPKMKTDNDDSTSLSDRSGGEDKPVSSKPVSQATDKPAVASQPVAVAEEVATPPADIPSPAPRSSFMSRQSKNLRDSGAGGFLSKAKRNDPTRIRKQEVESAARRDTPLERPKAELALNRRGSGKLAAKELHVQNDSDEEFVDAGSAVDVPISDAPAVESADPENVEPALPEPKMIRPSTSDGHAPQTPPPQSEKRFTLPANTFTTNGAMTPVSQVGTPASEKRPNLLRKFSKDVKEKSVDSPDASPEKKKLGFFRRVFRRKPSSGAQEVKAEPPIERAIATADVRVLT